MLGDIGKEQLTYFDLTCVLESSEIVLLETILE